MRILDRPRFWIPPRALTEPQQRVFDILTQHRWGWHTQLHCQCGLFCNRNGHDAHVAALVAEIDEEH